LDLDYLLNDSAPTPKREKIKNTPSEQYNVDCSEKLFNLLKDLRTDSAKKEQLSAYCTFCDRTLKEMASNKPDSINALLNIHGLGNKKIEKYGQAFFDVMIKFYSEHITDESPKQFLEPYKPEIIKQDQQNIQNITGEIIRSTRSSPKKMMELNHLEKSESAEPWRQEPTKMPHPESPKLEKELPDQILRFRLEEKTPLEAMMFIKNLQEKIIETN